jgi:hypothetical protein
MVDFLLTADAHTRGPPCFERSLQFAAAIVPAIALLFILSQGAQQQPSSGLASIGSPVLSRPAPKEAMP